MKNLKFKSGIVEVYDTKDEMISILSDILGKDEIEWCLKDERFKDSFNPNTTKSHYIKKVLVIKTFDNLHKTLMCFEHWNYHYEFKKCKEKIVVDNINAYSSGFACTVFRRPNKDLQKCFLEYYNTVRDDDCIEKILDMFKVGDKLYFIDGDKSHLSSETINYIGLDCKEEFVVEVGTNEREDMFAIVSLKSGDRCETYDCEKYLFTSLEAAKTNLLEELEKKKNEYKQKISNITKDILEAMSFVG